MARPRLLCDMNLCRLCGQENNLGANLFPTEENEPDLSELVNKYLPVKVENDGKFPTKICPGCNIQLEATKLFMELIIEGQGKLRQLYRIQQIRWCQQEKQRIKLQEALRNVNPTSSVDTYTIESDETGEKFVIQIYSEGPLFPPDHVLPLRGEGLDKPRRKRGRPPKQPPSDANDSGKNPNAERTEEVANKEDCGLEETLNEADGEGTSGTKRGRRIRVPTRYSGALQGKELDRAFKQEGVIDEESSESDEPSSTAGDEDGGGGGQKRQGVKEEEVIGRTENEQGEDLGQPVVVVTNKVSHHRGRFKVGTKMGHARRRRRFQCEICAREFIHYGRYMLHKKSHEIQFRCGEENCRFTSDSKLKLDGHQQSTGHSGAKTTEKVDKYGTLELPSVIQEINDEPEDAEKSLSSVVDSSTTIATTIAANNDKLNTAKEWRCDECNRNFTCKQNYEVHQKSVHLGERPHECTWCHKSFGHANTLRLHLIQHQRKSSSNDGADGSSGDMKYRCMSCPKVFRHPSSLQYHRDSVHTNGRRFVCNKCDKPFKHRQLLQRHQLVHSDERPHQCAICSSAFKTRANLIHHSRTVHAGQRSHWCSECDKSFVHKTAFELHRRWHNGVRPYQCEFCQKRFSQKGNLSEHRRIHTGEKPYQCDECERSFTTSSQYRLHRKRHSDDKPHKCEHCPRRFLHAVSLRCHLRRHFNERPFKCQRCEKTFPEAWALKKHERMHTGERPYKCDRCSRAFADSSNLTKHRKTHDHHNSIMKQANLNEQMLYLTTYKSPATATTTTNGKPQESTIIQVIDDDDGESPTISSSNNTVTIASSKEESEAILPLPDASAARAIQLRQLVDEEGNPISFTTEDGQQVKVVTNLNENGDEENIQGLLPDGTLIPIDFTTAPIATPVPGSKGDGDVDQAAVDPSEIQKLNASLNAQLLDGGNIRFIQDGASSKVQNNMQFITDDSQNMCLVTTYNIAEIEDQWRN